ncbi:MAG: type II toxin-antitoxin system MqsA family antitoxin [Deltaproteobacteria bacterium]|nr:type II toxin-antitoxin system MqsA family antitoxin [Deltaproteobacteria bacterium]
MKTCPTCGKGTLTRKTQRQQFRYQGKSLRYAQPGWWCAVCREGVLETGDMEETERLLYDFRATVDGYLTRAEMRRIRKKLGLTQAQAGALFGGGHNAFSRYESGAARPPKSTDALLRLLDTHPALLHEIPHGKAA